MLPPGIFIQMAYSFLYVLSVEVMKTESPQTMGVAELSPGSASSQATFSVSLHEVGRSFSFDEPLRKGPRHWGQFCPKQTPVSDNITINKIAFFIVLSLFQFLE